VLVALWHGDATRHGSRLTFRRLVFNSLSRRCCKFYTACCLCHQAVYIGISASCTPRYVLDQYPWTCSFGWCLAEGYGNGDQRLFDFALWLLTFGFDLERTSALASKIHTGPSVKYKLKCKYQELFAPLRCLPQI